MPLRGVEPGPRFARGIVAAVVAALVSIHFLKALGHTATDPAAGITVATLAFGVFVLQLRYTVERWRRWENGWVLALQAGFCYAAVGLGASVGLLCVLAAALLLERRWTPAVLVLASAALIDGIRASNPRNTVDVTVTVALGGVVLFGITQLAFLVQEVHAARLTLALTAAADERLRIAAELDTDLADGLAQIGAAASHGQDLDGLLDVTRASLASARGAAAGFRSLSLAPEAASAKALLAAARIEASVEVGHREPLGPAGALLAAVLREAVTDVVREGTARACEIRTAERDGRVVLRVVNDGVPTAERGAERLDELAAQVGAAGGRLTTGLEQDGRFAVEVSIAATPEPARRPAYPEYGVVVSLFVVLLVAFCIKAMLYVPHTLIPAAVVCLAAVCAVQVRYSLQDAQRGRRPALVLLILIAFVPLPWFGKDWGVCGFAVGELLMTLSPAAAAPLIATIVTAGGIVVGVHEGSAGAGFNGGVSALITGLVVYGLLRLARLMRQLRDSDEDLAKSAVVQERLRAARDLHDLLGHSLAAILLKGELARRLATSDPERAQSELRDIAAMAAQARRDLRTVTGESTGDLTFEAELASAKAVLTAAGVATEIEAPEAPMPDAAGAVLSIVLREAVTNILRHSQARNARIAMTNHHGAIRLEVENDGVGTAVTSPGSGIGNLAVRLAEHDGILASGPDDGWFLLRAEVSAARALQPAGLAGDPHGVGPVPRVEFGHDGCQVVANCAGG